MEEPDMHHSRLCAVLIDCKTEDVDEAARFWGAALGRPVDPAHPGSRGNYRMLATPPDEPIVQIQRVDHESRVHLDIETDDIPAEVARLERLGATVAEPPRALGGDAGADRPAVLRRAGAASRFP
jgi:predicted enzyme related to lactoylglutathione lyase